jgi:hypothetical protein
MLDFYIRIPEANNESQPHLIRSYFNFQCVFNHYALNLAFVKFSWHRRQYIIKQKYKSFVCIKVSLFGRERKCIHAFQYIPNYTFSGIRDLFVYYLCKRGIYHTCFKVKINFLNNIVFIHSRKKMLFCITYLKTNKGYVQIIIAVYTTYLK